MHVALLQLLHSRFIVIGSEEDIGCDNATRVAINRELNPPFEDLFDMAEDYALQTLYQVWSDMIIADNSNFEKVAASLLLLLYTSLSLNYT